MSVELCIRTRSWPGSTTRIVVIIVIIAMVARWQPGELVPLIIGTSLGCWLLVGQPATRMITP